LPVLRRLVLRRPVPDRRRLPSPATQARAAVDGQLVQMRPHPDRARRGHEVPHRGLRLLEVQDGAVTDYTQFLTRKAQAADGHGFPPTVMPDFLFGFQRELVDWAVRMGRAAVFADCGTGKSPMQLVWAENVRAHTGLPVLVVTPLAVSHQTVREAAKFGIEAATSRDGKTTAPITVTNYEQLEKFDPDQYGGVVCDESSAIKSFDGARRAIVTEFLRTVRYRLLCTATAAPNDYVELGTSSEALGYLGHTDMLSRFFVNDQHTSKAVRHYDGAQWRFKGHAQDAFWRWVTSWARAIRRPSDLGYPDDGFTLPPLDTRTHLVEAAGQRGDGLFDLPAIGLRETRDEARHSITERCEKAAELAARHNISLMWCQLNAEGDLLERLTPQSIQVKGSDSDDFKEEATRWFTGDLCICDRPLFRAKLAAWRGNLSTQHLDAIVTRTIRQNENGAVAKAATQSPTASTCAATTPRTRGDGNAPRSSGRPSTSAADSGTPRTLSIESGSSARPANQTQRPSGISGSADSSVSVPRSSTSASPNKAEAARSAELRSGTVLDDDSPSTTATEPAPSEASSARPAISDSASSGTTPIVWNEPPCICGHISGVRRLISKPVMFGWGLNFQHCSHMTYFPSYSYEQMYQAVRRSWRFGQQHPVTVDVVTTAGGVNVLKSLQRKTEQADVMFDALVQHMRSAAGIRRAEPFDTTVEVPSWAR
jgi:hypothetical protein